MWDEDFNEVIVVYLGGLGSYSYIVVQWVFECCNVSVVFVFKCDFILIFCVVESGEVDFGVILIENIMIGFINEVYDLFLFGNVKIVGEFFLCVDYCLIGCLIGLGCVNCVYGYFQVLVQLCCWLVSYFEIEMYMVFSFMCVLE